MTAPLVTLCPIGDCGWSLTDHLAPSPEGARWVAASMGVTVDEVLAAWSGQHQRTMEAAVEHHLTKDHDIVDWMFALRQAQAEVMVARIMLANMANEHLRPQLSPLQVLAEMDKVGVDFAALRKKAGRG